MKHINKTISSTILHLYSTKGKGKAITKMNKVIQNTIFKLINNNNKMFCVGDVKQSISKFRHSKPQIFLRKKRDYQLYSKEENN